jgi:thioredoxin
VFFLVNCGSETGHDNSASKGTDSLIVHLTDESFRKLIFNYEKNDSWQYEGNKPAIIDFYADWCAPCKKMAPYLDEIAEEYKGKINVYKVDTQKENYLTQNVGVTGLPTLLFIPAEGKPRASVGLISKDDIRKAINEVLQIN